MNSQLLTVVALGAAFFLSRSIMSTVIDFGERYHCYDSNNQIKLHHEKVPCLGGVAIFMAFWIVAFLFLPGHDSGSLFVGSSLLFLVGLRDDLLGVHAIWRLAFQLTVAVFLVHQGVQLQSLSDILTNTPHFLSAIITVIYILSVINAYNFIDGTNGLAGGLAITAAISFCIFLFIAGEPDKAIIAGLFAGAMLGFLGSNFGRRAKAFMGDNGSTFSGLMLAILSIYAFEAFANTANRVALNPFIAFVPLLIPTMDMARVIFGRLKQGTSPFRGDRTHLHHLLQNKGWSPIRIAISLMVVQVVIIALSFLFFMDYFLLILLALVLSGALYLRTAQSAIPAIRDTRNKDALQINS